MCFIGRSKLLKLELRLWIPIAGSASDIFRMDTLNIFGKIVWMPYAELLTPIIIMVVCIPATVKRWIKMKNG